MTRYVIAYDSLCIQTERCTGGACGLGYGHEPGCGLEQVATLGEVLEALQVARRMHELFSDGGPDTPCRTVWRDLGGFGRLEHVEVPMEDLRHAFGDGPVYGVPR